MTDRTGDGERRARKLGATPSDKLPARSIVSNEPDCHSESPPRYHHHHHHHYPIRLPQNHPPSDHPHHPAVRGAASNSFSQHWPIKWPNKNKRELRDVNAYEHCSCFVCCCYCCSSRRLVVVVVVVFIVLFVYLSTTPFFAFFFTYAYFFAFLFSLFWILLRIINCAILHFIYIHHRFLPPLIFEFLFPFFVILFLLFFFYRFFFKSTNIAISY